MMPARRTFLAWRNLVHDRRRLLLALGGIGFAVLLMCMQLSFQQALFDSTLALVRALNADLVITSQAKYTVVVREPFTRRRLYQALACQGVETAYPLYVETQLSILKNLDEAGSAGGGEPSEAAKGQPIRVLAFDPSQSVLDIPQVRQYARELQLPGTALFDLKSKETYGQVRPGSQVELAGQRVRIVGMFGLGTDFSTDGNMITSDINFRALFGRPGPGSDPLASVDIGLLKLAPDQHPEQVKRRLGQLLPDDVIIMTRQEFEDQERRFWEQSTPIGYVFWLGTVMGFVVGIVICYQILYADIADHLGEFATLKAMGYQGRYFIGVVLQEAVLLSLLGFLPGVAVSQVLCMVVAAWTGLLVELKWSVVVLVLTLSVVMCVASGCLTMRKVLTADPAELF